MMTIIWFLILLTIIVFVHEMGHYLVARINGVKVEVFSVGFGKELFGWNDSLGTRWKICFIPLGGYVKFFGDANLASSLSDKNLASYTSEKLNKTFISKTLSQKAAIVFAGPFANFLFAFLVFFLMFQFIGTAKDTKILNIVNDIVSASPADKAGIFIGDEIIGIDGSKTYDFYDIKKIVEKNPSNELKFTVIRFGKEIELIVVPDLIEDVDERGNNIKYGRVGISPKYEIIYEKLSLFNSLKKSLNDTALYTIKTFEGIAEIITGKRSASELGGPIMIATVAGKAADRGIEPFLFIMAIISINLGLINLFPIPLLDGGHLFLFLVQAIKKSPINEDFLKYYSMVGISILLGLMILVNYNDLFRLLN